MAATVATAQAQDDPYATVEEQAETSQLDTDLTPVAKESPHWDLLHGAEYPTTQVVDNSATSFDTELFAVSFRNTQLGLAGGSACADEPVQQQGEDNGEFGSRVAECKGTDGSQVPRIPALYRFTASADQDDTWERLELPTAPGLDHPGPGYIGAIAWIDERRALIVGGTGAYPRREEPADPLPSTDPDKPDVAGKARAWLYTAPENPNGNHSIEDLDLSSLTADDRTSTPERAGMRGLTAVDCYEDPNPTFGEQRIELCFAGALGQIWEWGPEGFAEEPVDAQSPASEISGGAGFRYRVRDIGFAKVEPPRAAAVTAGCCSPTQTENAPAVLTYQTPAAGPGRWSVGSLYAQPYHPELPDSFYSLMFGSSAVLAAAGPGGIGSVIASPGAKTSEERPSAIASRRPQAGHDAIDLIRTPLSTARLLFGDGDIATSDRKRLSDLTVHTADAIQAALLGQPPKEPDGVPDWVVGELRSTKRTGLGAQGLVVATALPPTARDSVNSPPATPEEITGGWEPIDQEKLDAHIRSRHYLLPSYTANSIDILGAEDDGWAVGDHGAILRLDTGELQQTAAAAEPKPPKLGAAREARLSDRDAYPGQVLPGTTGGVPALGELGAQELDEPEMVPMGAPRGRVAEIVMSRDASEGWAIGNDAGGATFSYFDGQDWRRCDPVGIEGRVEPDPACEAMAPLRGYRDAGGNLQTVRIDRAARVPLENDRDPTNDDELEIVAIGGAYQGPETGGKSVSFVIVRYRDGRWRIEDPAQESLYAGFPQWGSQEAARDLVFTGPADGWTIGAGGATAKAHLYRFDGERWHDCTLEPARCGDQDQHRLPTVGRQFGGLAVAGERVYLYGMRVAGGDGQCAGTICSGRQVPLIIYRDPGGSWTDGSGKGEDGAGFDPGFANPATEEAGGVAGLSVVKTAAGYEGWAVGAFGTGTDLSMRYANLNTTAALMRLAPGSGWQRFQSPGALEDHMLPILVTLGGSPPTSNRRLLVGYPAAAGGAGNAFIGQESTGSLFGLDATRERFELLETARPQGNSVLQLGGRARPSGVLKAMAPDGEGGFWAAIGISQHGDTFFHHTDRPPKPIFTETPNPLGPRGAALKALDAGPDGSIWAATDSERVYRFSRGLGWEEVRIPGWDPGRVVTRASQAQAIAVGPTGEGLLVGEQGRIARLSPTGVKLDPAAGTSCALRKTIPCGTSRDLTSVDIAPDGAAIAAGEGLTLLWRPPSGDFRAIEPKPRAAASTTISAVSFPTPTRAYLATETGRIYRGDSSGAGDWSWTLENADAEGKYVSGDKDGKPIAIADLALDAEGHGYAVGEQGMIVERTEAGGWRRLPTRYPYDLTSVALPESGGEGVLIGGESGVILTGSGSAIEVARHPQVLDREIVGLAYLPGSTEGSVDAWAGIGGSRFGAARDGSRLFRYRSDPTDPLLEPGTGAGALPDAPAHQTGELSLAAFGKSDCDKPESELCPQMTATTTTNEVISQRIVDELADLREAGELELALQTGDAVDSAGLPASSLADIDRLGSVSVWAGIAVLAHYSPTGLAGQLKHRRYTELIADPLADEDVPLFAAIGSQDLTETYACNPDHGCDTTKELANAGENYAWREAFAGRADPWGDGSEMLATETEGALAFEPAPGSEENSLAIDDQRADVDGEGTAPGAKAAIGGAATHYAIDALRDADAVARIVFVDTSLKSLAASDPLQQPHELAGGQTRFLERMICTQGETTSFGDECTREPDQKAIVVSNTPSYSYGPGALTHTATDATAFEALMLRHRVDLVVSGALGYNGLYYTLAPGVHEPCPAGDYPRRPPSGRTPDCLAGPADPAAAATGSAPADLPDPASLVEDQGLAGAYPTLIASGAGGKFGPDGNEPADGVAGQWHGYSLARLLPGGDLVVEQRPILDWIGLDAADRSLAPKARLKLNGYGRSPVSTSVENEIPRAYHYEISNAAITHRYYLLLADPDEPWLPCSGDDINCQELHANLSKPSGEAEATPTTTGEDNPCSPYLCLPSRIGVVDDQSGQVRAGDGKYPETFAIAMLSVDEEVATYPLVFKSSPAFVTSPSIRTGALPQLSGARPGAPPPPPPPPGLPQIPQVDIPQIPPPPGLPQLTAATPPELQPPAPPAPPPPSQQPAPLDLSVAPPGVSISTPTALIQPPTPPVNPAPPGGARREARQRQAAAQKGGAEGDGSEAQENGGDLADKPSSTQGAAATRHESGSARQDYAFTRLEERGGGVPGLPIVAGLTLAAFAMAAGFSTLRPGPAAARPRSRPRRGHAAHVAAEQPVQRH